MWTRGLAPWYRRHGRHELPWRQTRDPWAVLVSEVMLQQTQVTRVITHWARFVARWPTAESCAQASLTDVLLEWRGLGYPRRARALWVAAAQVSAQGWPQDEQGMRTLPGVGAYTARALLALSSLEGPALPPLDVNIARVIARAAWGVESHEARRRDLEAAFTAGRPRSLDRRQYVFALFDTGALHCRATPRCAACPLRGPCASRLRLAKAQPAPRRKQGPYGGSMRQLRGALLNATLAYPHVRSVEELTALLGAVPLAGSSEHVHRALASLAADGLLSRPIRASRDPASC